jgi:uncharacterized protein YciI
MGTTDQPTSDEQSDAERSEQAHGDHLQATAERKQLKILGIFVAILALFIIALGIIQYQAYKEAQDQGDCVLEVASATTGARDAAVTWLEDVRALVNAPPEETSQLEAQENFNSSIDAYLDKLKAAGVSDDCLEQVKQEADELADSVSSSGAGEIGTNDGE